MNCNEEFVVKALGKLTLEFNYDWENQKKIRELLHICLYNYEVVSAEKSLITSDLNEKILLYLQVKKLENYSKATLSNYMYTLRNFSTFINKPVSTITKNDIRYFMAINYTNLKPSTVNNKLASLKAFFEWMEQEEIIPKNPARHLSGTRLPKRLRKSLTIEELEKIRLVCKDVRERVLIEFLFATGCRISEVVKANISDLDLSNNSLRVIGKGDKQRIVFFSDKTKLHLKNYIDTRKDNEDALFISSKFPYNRISKRGLELIVSKIGERSNIGKPVFPHLLRHTMATLGLQSGADITTIQHLLGHTTPSTTQIYAENSLDNLKHEYKQHFNC
ncbi:site-specific tyrosine recombinase/integron integrase [Clostridium butyricum]|uniref:Phage integrase n=1 Tax=Clostridium butyricum E4 str. BoNT E BL5262 TaxID=632245 RepID=C4II13_CLOBU|nr:site-specific tyrosine recombinase/integron integrase [Clostridium butyricum]EDT76491.1 integrase/recombinase, phage integrase family [Clostridium butyricum 5521]EEP53088.1 phage integrase [Clostridium butyricum E4 str. BoNT E BL5262]NFL32432.1 integrase [Clostridium butyricum]NFS18649.1 integrase [Clostridium butyricum]